MRSCILLVALVLNSPVLGQDADTYYLKGIELADQGKFEEAIPLFSKSIELQPANTFAWFNRGIMKSILNWPEEALPDFEEAIRLDSTYKPARLNRGTARKRLTDYAGAMADYNYVLRLDPNYADAHYQRGSIFEMFGLMDSACWSYRKAFDNGLTRASQRIQNCDDPERNAKVNSILSLKRSSQSKKYGFSEKDPVKVGSGPDGGPGNQRAYLMLLRDAKGRSVKFSRAGSCCPYKTPNGLMGQGMLDRYTIVYLDAEGVEREASMYITFYDYEEPMIPAGFYTVKTNSTDIRK